MSGPLFRFIIQLYDERGNTWNVDFREAPHPSETSTYFLSRVLAFALHSRGHALEFSPGLCHGELPAIQTTDTRSLWVLIGSPSRDVLDRALRKASELRIYCDKDPERLESLLSRLPYQDRERTRAYRFDDELLAELEARLERRNEWVIDISTDRIEITGASPSGEAIIGTRWPIIHRPNALPSSNQQQSRR